MFAANHVTLLQFALLDFTYLHHRYVSTGGDNEWKQDKLTGWPQHADEDNDPCQEKVCHFLELPIYL